MKRFIHIILAILSLCSIMNGHEERPGHILAASERKQVLTAAELIQDSKKRILIPKVQFNTMHNPFVMPANIVQEKTGEENVESAREFITRTFIPTGIIKQKNNQYLLVFGSEILGQRSKKHITHNNKEYEITILNINERDFQIQVDGSKITLPIEKISTQGSTQKTEAK